MTTYTAIFQSIPAKRAEEMHDGAGIEEILVLNGAKNTQFQLGNPNSRTFKLVQFEADLVLADVDFAMKNAFQLGMGPIHLVEGNFTDARSWAQDAMITDIWSDQAIRNATEQGAADRQILDLIGNYQGRRFRTYGEVHKDPSTSYTMLHIIRDLMGKLERHKLIPNKAELEREQALLEAEMAGVIERYAKFHRERVRVIFALNPDSMARHSMYQGTSGLMNLHLQDVIGWYRGEYAPTNDNGEYEDGADQALGDFATTLINFLDDELDMSQYAQFQADKYFVGLGHGPYELGSLPKYTRLDMYETLQDRFQGELEAGLAEIQRRLGLTDQDVKQ